MDQSELEALRDENERLRDELSALRARLEPPPQPHPPERPDRARHYIVYRVDAEAVAAGRPDVGGNVARTAAWALSDHMPGIDWIPEPDLDRIPDGAACFHLADVVKKIFGAPGDPPIFGVRVRPDGSRELERVLVDGERESELFKRLYDRHVDDMRDLLAEGAAASEAGEAHHAGWTLKAFDVIEATAKLGMYQFKCGDSRWRETLSASRAEYEPRGDRLVGG